MVMHTIDGYLIWYIIRSVTVQESSLLLPLPIKSIVAALHWERRNMEKSATFGKAQNVLRSITAVENTSFYSTVPAVYF